MEGQTYFLFEQKYSVIIFIMGECILLRSIVVLIQKYSDRFRGLLSLIS
jgi:hypothetical protein